MELIKESLEKRQRLKDMVFVELGYSSSRVLYQF